MKRYLSSLVIALIVGVIGWKLTGQPGFGLLMFAALFLGSVLGRKAARGRVEKHVEEAQEKKEDNKFRLEAFILEKHEVSNDDVQKFLGVSDATATRYLDELEAEGKVESFGETSGTKYRLK